MKDKKLIDFVVENFHISKDDASTITFTFLRINLPESLCAIVFKL